ncbi:hypothetical protein CR513_46187, partial [Mucuna pruriens]
MKFVVEESMAASATAPQNYVHEKVTTVAGITVTLAASIQPGYIALCVLTCEALFAGGIYGDINPSGIMFYNKIIDNLLLRGEIKMSTSTRFFVFHTATLSSLEIMYQD